MKNIAAIVCAGALLCSGASLAQDAQQWSTPDGVFSVTIPAGWQVDERGRAPDTDNRRDWLAVSRTGASGYNRCDLRRGHEQTPAPLSQQELNDRMPQTLEAWGGGPDGVTIQEFTSELEGDVRINSYWGESSVGSTSVHERFAVFIVVHDAIMTEYMIRCILRQPAPDEDIAAAAAFINSVTFNH